MQPRCARRSGGTHPVRRRTRPRRRRCRARWGLRPRSRTGAAPERRAPRRLRSRGPARFRAISIPRQRTPPPPGRTRGRAPTVPPRANPDPRARRAARSRSAGREDSRAARRWATADGTPAGGLATRRRCARSPCGPRRRSLARPARSAPAPPSRRRPLPTRARFPGQAIAATGSRRRRASRLPGPAPAISSRTAAAGSTRAR